MASEVAHPEPVKNTLAHNDAPPLIINGDGDHHAMTDTSNADAFEGDAAISNLDSNAIPNNDAPTETTASETIATDAQPIEHVASGITSVADFMPKDAPTSHPTPPPDDEPLVTPDPNVDTVMASVEQVALPPSTAELQTEPAVAQESFLDPALDPVKPTGPAEPLQPSSQSATDSVVEPANGDAAQPKPDDAIAPVSASSELSLVRPREDDDDGQDEERAAKRTRVDETGQEELCATAVDTIMVNGATNEPVSAPTQAESKIKTDAMDVQPAESTPTDAPATEPAADVKPQATESLGQPAVTEVKAAADPPAAPQALASASTQKYSTQPMTPAQTRFLQEKMKNLKKTKNSLAFLHPVDPVAHNIPTYTEIIKQPMDLGTMEQKLKTGQYGCVQDFADDFNLIIHNTRTFNGSTHAVTQAGMAMEAYFRKMLETVPSANQPAQAKPQPKKASPRPAAPARRESRSAHPAPTSATASSDTFALQPDGTPQIRRESTTNRPARVIKAPPPRELAYAKPKRKEHQLELRFAEDVLNKIRGPKYANLATLFSIPVDPVALNIPHYRQIVKNPMDLGTMAQKLKNGQYSRAAEVKKDFDLMIGNCLAFNPNGNPVRDMGIQLQREFESLWREKDRWEKKQRQARPASASEDEDSAEEEEDEEEEQPQDAAQTILALQKQLADMQNALAGLGQAPKQKKPKTSSKNHSKKGAPAPLPKSKPAPPTKPKTKKGTRDVTYEEKQEISEAVGKMDGGQVEQLTNIITSHVPKYAEQEEMELEIDDLPNNVQAMLLTFVRGIFGNPRRKARAATPDDGAGADDDDFEPGERRGAKSGGGKRKKHKPMGKGEQQAAIENIQKQLAQFDDGASGGGSPNNTGFAASQPNAETSGDESEESEEE